MVNVSNGWFHTDELQYARKISDTKYHYIEAIWLDDLKSKDVYAVCANTIDINELSQNDIELAISGYYKDIESMEKSYGMTVESGDLNQIIAECYFEEHCLYDNYSLGGTYTLAEAEKKIEEYMVEN